MMLFFSSFKTFIWHSRAWLADTGNAFLAVKIWIWHSRAWLEGSEEAMIKMFGYSIEVISCK